MTSPVRGDWGYPSLASTTVTRGAVRVGAAPAESTRGDAQQEVEEALAVERGEDLGLGIAEAHVVLEQLRPVVVSIRPGVEDAAKVDAATCQLAHGRRDDVVA